MTIRYHPGRSVEYHAAYRFYNQYEMSKECATREITVRLHNSAEEEARSLNRAENLRAIPPRGSRL